MYELRVLLSAFPPLVEQCVLKHGLSPTSGCFVPGLNAERLAVFVQKLSAAINFTFIVQEQTPSWPDIFRSYENGSIDLCGYISFYWTAERHRRFKFAHPWPGFTQPVALTADEAGQSAIDMSLKIISVFQPIFWMVLLVSWMAFALHARIPRPRNVKYAVVLTLCGALLSLFTFDLYANGILARLMVHEHKMLFHDTESLANAVANGKARLGLLEGTAYHTRLWQVHQELKQKNQVDTDYLSPVEKLAKAVFEEPDRVISFGGINFAHLDSHTQQQMLHDGVAPIVPADIETTVTVCDSHAVPMEGIITSPMGMMFSPHTPDWVVDRFSDVIVKYNQVLEGIREKYDGYRTKPLSCPATTPLRVFTFSWSQCLGVLSLFVVGVELAVLLLIVECAASKHQNTHTCMNALMAVVNSR